MKILFLILALFSFLAQAQDTAALQHLLDIDRFHAYMQRWALTMEGREKQSIAHIIKAVTPAEIEAYKIAPKKLGDVFAYDDMILEILKKKRPDLKVTRADVAWDYNFYKRKLAEAYVVGDTTMEPVKSPIVSDNVVGTPLVVAPADPDEILLNVDGYATGKSTRAMFWEASQSNRPVELHVGTAGDFRASLAERGGKILGLVKTLDRNYDPIYLIQLPGEKDYRYAVTEISGADRLEHFAMKTELVRWEGTKRPSKTNVSVFGKPEDVLGWEKMEAQRIFEALPKADRVIIGQKGALDRTISAFAKTEAIIGLMKKHPKELEKVLPANLLKVITEAKSDLTALNPANRKIIGDIEEIYEAAEPLFKKLNVPAAENYLAFDMDRGSYSVSDVLLEDANGKSVRWRIFSNSWGDEVVPGAQALKATGHTRIEYIGTAGGFQGTGLKVGDLVIPSAAIDKDGNKYTFRHSGPMPEMAKEVDAVINVATPYKETKAWKESARQVSQVVEIETAYLAQVFNGPNDRVTPYLLISDIVGVEGETLAEASASSSQRAKAQQSVLAALFEEDNIRGVVTATLDGGNKIAQWVDEVAPGRDEVSRFQLIRKAQEQGLATKAQVEKFIKTETGFTTKRLETELFESGKRFDDIMEFSSDFKPKVSIGKSFLEGTWNPVNEPIEIHIQVSTKKAEEQIAAALAKYKAADKKFGSFVNVTVAKTAAGGEFVRLPKVPEFGPEAFLEMYKDSALGFGGLAATENRSGAMKFVQVAPTNKGKARATLAFFAPDDATAEILDELDNAGAEKVLKKEIAAMNDFAGPNDPWKIKLSVVPELAGDNLAQIVPEIAGEADNLTIHLRVTKEALKNPAVVMEELIHLQQITGAPVPWKANTNFKAFVHPFHWAEVVANAQAGSIQASEKIARLEVEAAHASDDALSYYAKQGLFKEEKATIEKYLQARQAHAEELYAGVAKEARADTKAKNAAWERAKKVFDKLEAQSTKLNDLVAKNDRKGARKLVEQYLPWDLMEPSEKKAWTEWLEAMESPDAKKSKIVFRGMYDDMVMKNAKGEVYLMSTVLTKNQGSYTRRLRSLATMREKFGMEALRDADSVYNLGKNPGSISVMMANHAIEAKGSPFLSTASYDVATKFGPRKLGTFQIDERRLILNALSPDRYLYQHEMLTPLFIFPDEVVHYHDYANNPVAGVGPKQPELRKKHYIAELEKKLGRKVTDAEIAGVGNEKQFMQRSYGKLTDLLLDKDKLPKAGPGCSIDKKSCDCLFKALNALMK